MSTLSNTELLHRRSIQPLYRTEFFWGLWQADRRLSFDSTFYKPKNLKNYRFETLNELPQKMKNGLLMQTTATIWCQYRAYDLLSNM